MILRLFAAVLLVSLAPGSPAGTVDLAGSAQLDGRALPDAVIWIEAPDETAPAPAPAVLDQKNLGFSPHVLAVRVGTRVKFPNDDLVFHSVFSFHNGTTFNLGMYPVGAVKTVIFDRPGLSRVFCNIHPQMAAYVMAVDTPFFAVSDSRGEFVIHGLPPGTYQYHAWRPGGEILTHSATVGADALLVQWP